MVETRKTRIVCISDTHNQTPRLPAGDVLIHAGDLTNQGSYSELKKTVEWLEKADFEAKIVVAGNHEITLDAPFFQERNTKWKWPEPQDPTKCRNLLLDSPSITYLENTSATIYLKGPQTCLKVFGSPMSPGRRGWAFQYWDSTDADKQWASVEAGTDIVVTHTPAYGHLDTAPQGEKAGCKALEETLRSVKPRMHICGHIHGARGAEKVRWASGPPSPFSPTSEGDREDNMVDYVEPWTDPGKDNKKISLLDLTKKSWRGLQNDAGALPRHVVPDSLRDVFGGLDNESEGPQPDADKSMSTSSLEHSALHDNSEALWRRKRGGAIEHAGPCCGEVDADALGRVETAMINAAFLGPRIAGKAMVFSKPIVVDIDLPVWHFMSDNETDVQ